MRLKLISCEVLFREMCFAVARSPHQVDVEFLPKGLHDLGSDRMRRTLQECVDRVDAQYVDAVLMGYALCGNGLVGLSARTMPIVIPRAHDCIAVLMGSRQKYQEYFDANPGVYFRSTGWLERGGNLEQVFRDRTGVGHSLQELITQYGEDNGQYLYEQLTAYKRTYRQLTFIETGLEPDSSFEQSARDEAAQRTWKFEKVSGSLRLFEKLVSGNWPDDDFLIVKPGWRVRPRYDERILDVEEIPYDRSREDSGSH
jgi:Protein of unknown function (DUF1638)